MYGADILIVMLKGLRRKKLDILIQITYNLHIMYPLYEKEESFGRLISHTIQTPTLHQEPTF
jgi:hypothetical protein